MKRFGRYLPVPFLLLFCAQFAGAQSRFDLNLGFGAVQDKASSTGIDGATDLPCALGSTVTCSKTPSLSGFFMGFGGSLMLWKHLGAGAYYDFQPAKLDYANFTSTLGYNYQIRTGFYGFDGILEPVSNKKVTLQVLGGIGGANVKFYANQAVGTSLIGNTNSSQYFSSSNHFQVHAGVGVQYFINDHVFVRPEFDIHYVPNFNQFGSNLVKSEMVWIGYSFGER